MAMIASKAALFTVAIPQRYSSSLQFSYTILFRREMGRAMICRRVVTQIGENPNSRTRGPARIRGSALQNLCLAILEIYAFDGPIPGGPLPVFCCVLSRRSRSSFL